MKFFLEAPTRKAVSILIEGLICFYVKPYFRQTGFQSLYHTENFFFFFQTFNSQLEFTLNWYIS